MSDKLQDFIQEAIILERNYDEVVLTDGNTCPYGDPRHVKDIESILTSLECLKKQWRYSTVERTKVADVCGLLKRVKKKMLNKLEPVEVPVEQPRTFSSLESGHDRKKKKSKKLEGTPRGVPHDSGKGLGKTGYGRGAPAHGRYNPGQTNEKEDPYNKDSW